ncbi:MAG: hypothetical protein AAF063_38320, partial [Cyanobacteria bacterium J06643_5]
YRGIVLTETGAGESMAAFAEIDLNGLRNYRKRPGLKNLLARQCNSQLTIRNSQLKSVGA